MDQESTGAPRPDSAEPPGQATPTTGVNRRTLLAGGLAGGVGALAGFAGGRVSAGGGGSGDSRPDQLTYPFRGEHQQGVTTPAQQQMHLTAFDVTARDRDSLIDLLTAWTRAAENLTSGLPVDAMRVSKSAPPDDTGEAYDLEAAGLTITFGFGRTLFRDAEGRDRFGLGDRLPAPLAEDIPRMAAEKIDAGRSGGDLVVQACAEDPLVALHAVHNLTRIAFGWATVRWTQLGYGRTSSTGAGQVTPRNLFGLKDGTASLRGDQEDLLRDFVWVGEGDDAADWMAGGTYLCARKIRMTMEVWDELPLRDQENSVGRDKVSGAPLSGGDEFTAPDFLKRTTGGSPAIPESSHVALMHPTRNAGVHMLRRGYNYTDGSDELGRLDAGLFFIAFVRDPRRHFTPLLARMQFDLLTEYLQHLTSSVFAIPPGLREGETYVGQRLLTGAV
ncbi:iron uptake transporter deferrochelatase/peroxidase subunit [Rhodococcus sp. IEGM 1408]|uniref:iron uptake transporter deferrochelatase/peroxidase subunit n=1 Tax=Rhodococcus sp. IEGM 1408 TaxID=3082220 RepID=UPI002952A051|nr:iron uptake transporter deferrochelatase/peroxidase subunit [Rhodococcus sp. IEGM 1408]MDV8000788.1 iron uptake transporter deferrochelatase/peroxidase subunit [Rhodococcus sp. IEGM 1408]